MKSILLALVFFGLAALPAQAQEREKFLDIQAVTSPGGITAWLVEDHTIPVIAVNIAFRGAGSIHDAPDRQGTAMLLSNTLDEGAGELDSRSFQKTLADHSISLSYSTGRDDFFGSLKMLTREKDRAFDLLRLSLNAPRFEDDALNRMRNANLARLRSSLTDPEWIAARIMNDIAYAGHPYAQNSGGSISGLRSVTADDLRRHLKARLTRDTLVVAVAGAITPGDLARALDHVFLPLPSTSNSPQAFNKVEGQGTAGTVALYALDIPQTIIQIQQRGIDRKNPDWPVATVMNYILGGSGFGSRLMEEVREKRGLTYGIYTGFQTMDHANILSISTSTKNESVDPVLGLIRAEWARMRDAPVSDTELEAAISYLTGSMPLALSSTNSIAGMLLDMQLDDLPIDYMDTIADRIRAVTAADIRRVAQGLLKESDFITVLVGNPARITPTKTVTDIPNVE